MSVARKIIAGHLAEGTPEKGNEIAIKVDQTITQDATGTMACLQFEAMGIPKVKTRLSVSYVDHNMLQTGFENADDHKYLQTVAQKHGMVFSRPGNGICHQVHLERFAVPGETLVGSDSHTPTCGGMGMLAIGVGGLDVAAAMGGGPLYVQMPEIVGVKLKGSLGEWVSAKDIILELLRRLTVKGGVGKIFEYYGSGVRGLSVPERATITNMGAELGATTSIFPSDENTRDYLKRQKREKDWRKIAGNESEYDQVIELELPELEPMVAKPSSPDNVARISEVEGIAVEQVLVGSCTNSSFKDLTMVARIIEGKKVHPSVSMGISPGSRQVFEMISRSGALATMIASGARILESACGPCIGMGQAPATGAVSLRTFNRNFPGRSGTIGDKVYLVSPEIAAVSALAGKITDPRKTGKKPETEWPDEFIADESMFIFPSLEGSSVEVARGPNIKPLPTNKKMAEELEGEVLIKVGDNVSTDTIMPAGAKVLPLRSNIPEISKYVFSPVDSGFYQRAIEKKGGFIVGGENYGQGSSREHAALAPMSLGIKAVIAKSFARIHKANLINFGILPLQFKGQKDYDEMEEGQELEAQKIREQLSGSAGEIRIKNNSNGREIIVTHDLNGRQREIVLAGGLLNYTKGSE